MAVTITLPHLDSVCLLQAHGLAIWMPIEASNCDVFQYTSPLEGLKQGASMYGEKPVDHTKVEGELTLDTRNLSMITNIPTAAWPKAQRLVTGYSNGHPTALYENAYGFINMGDISYNFYEGYRSTVKGAIGGGSSIDVYTIVMRWANGTVINNLYKAVYYDISYSGNTMWCSFKFYVATFNSPPGEWTHLSQSINNYTGMAALLADCEKVTKVWNESVVDRFNHQPIALIRPYFPSGASPTIQEAEAEAATIIGHMATTDSGITPVSLGTLASEAVERIDASEMNTLEFLADFKNPSHLIPRLNKLKNIRQVSSAFLSAKFGLLSTIRDSVAYVEAVKAYKPRKKLRDAHSGRTQEAQVDSTAIKLEQSFKLQIYDEDKVSQQLNQTLDSFGLLPTTERLWDFVPFSFVVDWVIGVGDSLRSVDNRIRYMEMDIRVTVSSEKWTYTKTCTPNTISLLSGTVSLVQYHRQVSGRCPVPTLSLPPLHLPSFDNVISSTALYLQRRKLK